MKKKLSSGVPMELKIIRLRSPDEKKIMSQSRHRERPRFFYFLFFKITIFPLKTQNGRLKN